MAQDYRLRDVEAYVRERSGQRLPGERELSAALGLSRPRLRAILELLERDGLVQRRQGSGTYAIAADRRRLSRVALLVDASLKLGDDPFFSLVVERLQANLQSEGAECLIMRTCDDRPLLSAVDGVLALGVVGLKQLQQSNRNPGPRVTVSSRSAHSGEEFFEQAPVVGLFASATTRPSRGLSVIQLQDEDAGAEAGRWIAERRVTEAVFFGRRDIPAVQERYRGAERVTSASGIALTAIDCGLNYTAGLRYAATINIPERRFAWIAANDWLALGLHTGLQSCNPGARERLSLVSFDGLAPTRRPEVGIRSLAVPVEAIAVDAVEELKRLRCPGAVGRAIRYGLQWAELEDEDTV